MVRLFSPALRGLTVQALLLPRQTVPVAAQVPVMSLFVRYWTAPGPVAGATGW